MGFAQLFEQTIQRAGVSQNAAGPLIGCSGPFVNQIIREKRLPPLDQVSSWARSLGITEGTPEWDEWHFQAELSHCPPGIRARFASMIERIERMETVLSKDLADKDAEIARLKARIAELERGKRRP